jgi:formate hydrogenlyase subunit 3/multisubunit Na+/H+ antiporter MnhD subunit
LLQTIAIPIISAPILALLGRKIGKSLGWLVCGILTYTTVLLLLAGLNLWNGTSSIVEEYSWSTSVLNLKFGFLADGLSLPVALVVSLICTACSVYSISYMEHRIGGLFEKEGKGMYSVYYAIFMLFPAGLVGVAFSMNLIELYLFIELILIPAYFMIDFFGYEDRHRNAMMYFIWNHVGAALFLVGIVLAFAGDGGSFDVSALHSLSATSALWVSLLILVGLLVKMAAFGFHLWIRYAQGNCIPSIAPIIATVEGLGSYIIVRLLVEQLPGTFAMFSLPLLIWALVTMVYGAYLAIAQDDIILLYACSTISQTAYSLLGIASLTVLGISGGIFYFLSHVLGKCILFSIAGIMLLQTGLRDMRKMGGLARKMPLTATLCILGSMILSAIPPLSGFQAEWIMFTGIFQHGLNTSFLTLIIAIIGFFATFLSLIYTFWPTMRIFFGPLPESLENTKEAPYSMTVPLFVLAFVSFLIGVYPDLITHFLMPALHSLF